MRRVVARRSRSAVTTAGFSLVELLVSLAVVSVVSIVAFGILLEAGASFTKQDVDPHETLVLAQLRADLRASVSPVVTPGFWSSEDLLLTNHPAGTITLFRREQTLYRAVSPGPQGIDLANSRPLLNRVVNWRWRKSSRRVIEIEVGVLVGTPLGLRRGPAGVPLIRWTTENHKITVASRRGSREWL